MNCTVIDIRGDYAYVKYDDTGVVSEVAIALLPFGIDALKAAIEKYLPAKLQASNLKALELGQAALHM